MIPENRSNMPFTKKMIINKNPILPHLFLDGTEIKLNFGWLNSEFQKLVYQNWDQGKTKDICLVQTCSEIKITKQSTIHSFTLTHFSQLRRNPSGNFLPQLEFNESTFSSTI
jgi:hypothetical protein